MQLQEFRNQALLDLGNLRLETLSQLQNFQNRSQLGLQGIEQDMRTRLEEAGIIPLVDVAPTHAPTSATLAPTPDPTASPTAEPIEQPTAAPTTSEPTAEPTTCVNTREDCGGLRDYGLDQAVEACCDAADTCIRSSRRRWRCG